MKFTKYLCYVSLVGLTILFSCGKDNDDPGPEGPQGPQGPGGLKSLLDIKPIAAGDKCSTGGLVVLSGIDKNVNNKLDENEVENTQYICNGTNAQSDKQITIQLTEGVGKAYGAAEKIDLAIPSFKKGNFAGVDSIILVSRPWGATGTGNDNGLSTTVELYNVTDNVVIGNSQMQTNSGFTAIIPFVRSKNIFANLPDKEIDLGIRVTNNSASYSGLSGKVVMILYRK